MRKIVIVNESQFKRMVKNFLLEQNGMFPTMKDVTRDNTTYKMPPLPPPPEQYNIDRRHPVTGRSEPMKGVTVDNTTYKMPPSRTGLQRQYAVGNEDQTYDLKRIVRANSSGPLLSLAFTIAATATAFIPGIGPGVSAMLFAADAAVNLATGNYREGGASGLFAILSVAIPHLKIANLPILSKMPQDKILQIGTKISRGADLTKKEIQAANEVVNNMGVITTGIEKFAKSKNLIMPQSASKISAAVEKFKGEYLPFIVGKAGYEFGWEVGEAITGAKSTGSNW